MFKNIKDMTAEEYREMEITKMQRHDEINKLMKQLFNDEIDTFEFREKVINVMESPLFKFND